MTRTPQKNYEDCHQKYDEAFNNFRYSVQFSGKNMDQLLTYISNIEKVYCVYLRNFGLSNGKRLDLLWDMVDRYKNFKKAVENISCCLTINPSIETDIMAIQYYSQDPNVYCNMEKTQERRECVESMTNIFAKTYASAAVLVDATIELYNFSNIINLLYTGKEAEKHLKKLEDARVFGYRVCEFQNAFISLKSNIY